MKRLIIMRTALLFSVAAAFFPSKVPPSNSRRAGETKCVLDHQSKQSTFPPDAHVDKNELVQGAQENSTLSFTELNVTETSDESGIGGYWKRARWLVTGYTFHAKQSDEQVRQNLSALARLLILLRAYEHKFGVPNVCVWASGTTKIVGRYHSGSIQQRYAHVGARDSPRTSCRGHDRKGRCAIYVVTTAMLHLLSPLFEQTLWNRHVQTDSWI